MSLLTRVLWVDDQATSLAPWQGVFEEKGLELRIVPDLGQALDLVRRSDWDAYLVDLDLGDSADGVDMVNSLRKEDPDTPVFIVSAFMHEPQWRERLQRYPGYS